LFVKIVLKEVSRLKATTNFSISMPDIRLELNRYLSDLKNNKLTKPEACERCKKKGCLVWWSKYTRNLITFAEVFTGIPIKRVRCSACGGTFCSLPDFIIKFCRYGKNVIVFALKQLKRSTYEKAAERLLLKLSQDIEIAVHTLVLWKRKYTLAQLTPA